MSWRSRIALSPRRCLICRIAGLTFFAVAFFLPACQIDPAGSTVNSYSGWQCALMSISLAADIRFVKTPFFFAFMSGWINLLIPAYVAFSLLSGERRIRRALAIAIAICMISTWVFFALLELVPLAGHFLWVGGIVMILLPEVAAAPAQPDAGGPQAAA